VPLGRDPADHRHPLHAAVMASCSVPGFYEPVRLGRRLLVDGGVRSSASIDYAVRYGCNRLIAVVPLGHEPPGRPRLSHRFIRSTAMAATRRELRRAGDRARDVLVIQPAAEDLALHGTNFLRSDGNDEVAERAHHRTRMLTVHDDVRRFLAEAQDPESPISGDGRG
jgi:NTE family protein